MVKGLIDVIVRSKTEEEVRPGVFKYSYEMFKNVPANLPSDLSYSNNDSDSINLQRQLSNDFTFIFANNSLDRIRRISYIRYAGDLYKVSRIVPYPPRVRVSVGDFANIDLSELGLEE